MGSTSASVGEVLGWLYEPRAGRGLHLAVESGWKWDEYPKIAREVSGVAAQLLAAGISRGDIVSIVLPSGPRFISTLFGILAAGGTPSPLVPPAVGGSAAGLAEHVGRILRVARPWSVVTENSYLPFVSLACRLAGTPDIVRVLEPGLGHELPSLRPADLALLQFTSGSSGTPRGVQVTWESLAANLGMIKKWLRWSDDDRAATWLPLYHDMGLIGSLLVSVTAQCDLWMMTPEQFVRRPLR
jgi:acyl-CoA synthetase (AMP-forming)/AMP-acid ligase II